jgi:hypothetical protein
MGGACRTYGREERCILGVGRPSRRLEDKMGRQEVGWGPGRDSSGSKRDIWRELVNSVMNFRFQETAGNFVSS